MTASFIVTVSTDRFVYFDQNGEIIKITNYADDSEQYITLPFDSVKNLVSGKDHFFDYEVSYDLKTKSHAITKKSSAGTLQDSIHDRMYAIPTTNIISDLTIVQNLKSNSWIVKLNQDLVKQFLTNKISNNLSLLFSITMKDNPTCLYRSFEIPMSVEPTEIPFKYETEKLQNITIYTIKRLSSYNHEVIYE